MILTDMKGTIKHTCDFNSYKLKIARGWPHERQTTFQTKMPRNSFMEGFYAFKKQNFPALVEQSN